MNTMLPAPRDLPPARRAQIRAELERLTAQPVRQPRRWVIAAAVTAGLTVLATAAWVLPRYLVDENQPAGPPPVDSPVLNLSDRERASIEQGCGRALVGDPATPRRPGMDEGADSFRVYNYVVDDAGRAALLYGQTAALYCLFDEASLPHASVSALANTGPPDGPLTVDLYLVTRTGEVVSTHPDRPDVVVLAGRVGPEVARVTIEQNRQVLTASVANRSFFGRLLNPSPWINQGAHGPVIRAYDSSGRLVATVGG